MNSLDRLSPRIVYLGDDAPHSTSCHRANALRRIGCSVDLVNPCNFLPPLSRWKYFFSYRTGFRFSQKRILHQVISFFQYSCVSYDLVWVNGGELLGPATLAWLRSNLQAPILLYQNDDPTGTRDGARFESLRASLPFYDLCAFVRPETALESSAYGATKTLRVLMSFDEEMHAAHPTVPGFKASSFVSFIGTLIPGEGRDRFLLSLIKAGIPLKIVGNNWHRSKIWPLLKVCFAGPAVAGRAYARSLRSASVCLGFLSHQNRDLVTRRSFETLACGGLFCAERTSEHQLLYEEGVEAVFWDTAEECAEKCKTLLADPELNHSVRSAGSRRVREMGVGNEDICRQILAYLL